MKGFKEERHARGQDVPPASLFIRANLLHLAITRWPADSASFNRLTAGHKSAAHSSRL